MNQTISKLFFTRHGETTEAKSSSEKQTKEAILSPIGREQVKKNGKKLKRLLDLHSKVVFLYDQNTERTKESLFYLLKEVFGEATDQEEYTEDNFNRLVDTIKNNDIGIKADDRLGSMEKDFDEGVYIPNRQIDQSSRKDKVKDQTSELLLELLSPENSTQEGIVPQYVLVGHKSNAESIVKAGNPQSDKKMRIDHDEIIDLDIVESDIRKGELDYEVKYYDHDTKNLNISKEYKLYLNTQTIDDIIDALKDIDGLKVPSEYKFYLNNGAIDVLKDIDGLKVPIQKFLQKEMSLVELQNIINEYFRADYLQYTLEYQKYIHDSFQKNSLADSGESEPSSLYQTYLDGDNFDISLFCLANLMVFGRGYESIKDKIIHLIHNIDDDSWEIKLKAIFDLFMNPKCYKNGRINSNYLDLFFNIVYVDGRLSDKLNAYFKDICNNKQKEIIRNSNNRFNEGEKSLVSILDYVGDYDYSGFELPKKIGYYENLMKHHEKHIQPNMSEIRNKSLDDRFNTKKDNKEIDNNFDLGDKNIEENCLKILDNNQTVVIEGDGGSGKSFFSVYFQEQLRKKYFIHNSKSYFPVFIQLSGKDWTKVIGEIEEQQSYYKNDDYTISGQIKGQKDDSKQIVYFFESLDESEFCNESGIRTFLEYIQQNNLKSIINTRAGYLDAKISDAEKGNIKKYNIKGMKNPIKYVEDYFEGDKNKIEKYKDFEKQIGEKYIQENSLFVTILCELIQEGGEKLEKIDSKWKLFGAIVEQRLIKWEVEKREIIIDVDSSADQKEERKKEEIENRLKSLEEIAYKKISSNDKINKADIQKIMKDCKNPNIQALSFLFKKNDQGEYGFIHQSFEDFFAAKKNIEILEEKGKDREKYLEDLLVYKIDKINYSMLKFICDMCNKQENNTIREVVISYIRDNNCYFGNNQDKIALILNLLDHEKFKKYVLTLDQELLKLIIPVLNYNDKRNIEFVKSLKTDYREEIILLVVEVLGKIGGEENIKFINIIANENGMRFTCKIIKTLGKIGGEENTKIIKSFINHEYYLDNVILALGDIGGEDNVDIIKSFRYHKKSEVINAIIISLGKIGGEKNMEIIRSFKNHADETVILKLIEMLGKIGGKENMEIIRCFKNHKNPKVVCKMIEVLNKLQREENIDFIMAIDPWDENIYWAKDHVAREDELVNYHNYEVERMIEDDKAKKWKIEHIMKVIQGKKVHEIRKMSEIDNRDSLMLLFDRLLEQPSNHGSAILRSFTNHLDSNVACEAIYKLGMIGGKENVEFIRSFKNSEDPYVICLLIVTLGKIGGKENINIIKSFRKSSMKQKNHFIIHKIIRVLSKIGGKENLDFVMKFYRKDSPRYNNIRNKLLDLYRNDEVICSEDLRKLE